MRERDRRRLCRLILSGVFAWSVAGLPVSWAKQEVTVSDDTPIAVDISASQLTLIKMPGVVVPNGLITVSPSLEIRANGKNVAIDPKGTTQLADLVVMTEHQAYMFQLRPKPIAAETIVVQDVRLPSGGGKQETDPLKRLEGYVDANVELLKQAVQGALPKGYVARDIPKNAFPKWLEMDVWEGTEFRGPVYTVSRYRLYNRSDKTQSLRQTEFFSGSELSIGLNRHVIKPTEDAVVYIVTYSRALPPDQKKANSPDPEPWRRN